MIVTEQKKLEEILNMLKDAKNVFVVGCGACATANKTGGEDEVKEISGKLKAAGKTITGSFVPESTCDSRLCKKEMNAHKKEIDEADTFLVMSCGAGVQTITALIGKAVYPALNSLFTARIERAGRFYEMCISCGDCQLDKTGGICLMTRCPKNTLNGPCGGSVNGKCEVNTDNDCAWALVEERLEMLNKVDDLKDFQPVKDWTAAIRPHKVEKV